MPTNTAQDDEFADIFKNMQIEPEEYDGGMKTPAVTTKRNKTTNPPKEKSPPKKKESPRKPIASSSTVTIKTGVNLYPTDQRILKTIKRTLIESDLNANNSLAIQVALRLLDRSGIDEKLVIEVVDQIRTNEDSRGNWIKELASERQK